MVEERIDIPLEKKRSRKFDEIKDFMEENKARKTGKANVGRFCIDLAHKKMEELKEAEEEKVEDYRKYKRQLEELLEEYKG